MVSLCFSWTKAPAIPPAPEFRYCKNTGGRCIYKINPQLDLVVVVVSCQVHLVGAPAGEVDSPVVQPELHVSSCVGTIKTDVTALTEKQEEIMLSS